MSYGFQALKLIIGLLVLTLTLRLLGKHTIAQITPYDLVYIIVFGGILDSTFYDDKIAIVPFVFSTIIWSLSIYIIEVLVRRFHIFRVIFRGTPDNLIEDGKLNIKLFNKNNLDMEQLRIILRQNGIYSLKEVKDIYIEPDGAFSINKYSYYQPVLNSSLNIKGEETYPNILLIDQGEIETKALKYIGKNEEWLRNEMNQLGLEDISNIIYCEWSEKEGFYYKDKTNVLANNKEGHIN